MSSIYYIFSHMLCIEMLKMKNSAFLYRPSEIMDRLYLANVCYIFHESNLTIRAIGINLQDILPGIRQSWSSRKRLTSWPEDEKKSRLACKFYQQEPTVCVKKLECSSSEWVFYFQPANWCPVCCINHAERSCLLSQADLICHLHPCIFIGFFYRHLWAFPSKGLQFRRVCKSYM